MQGKLQVVVAGQTSSEIPLETWKALAELGYVEHKSVSSVGFCRAADGSRIVVLPKAFTQPAAKKRVDENIRYKQEQVFTLVRVFRKILDDKAFAQSHVDSTHVKGVHGLSVDPVLDNVEAAIRLRADYRRHGLWVPKRRVRTRNTPGHPVDWPATMGRVPPLLDGKSIIFPNTIHRKRTKDPGNLFSQLHAYILRQVFIKTGEKHMLGGLPVSDEANLKPVLKSPLAYLRAFRREIFSDRGRMLLACAEAYLGISGLKIGRPSSADDCLSYTSSFEHIWEFILARIFQPEAEPKFELAEGQWVSWPALEAKNGIRPVADLLVRDPQVTIIDAKDYRIFNGSPLLGSRLGSPGDHYKQIIYRTLMAAGSSPAAVNILAFPSIDQTSLFQLNGCHHWPSISQSPVFEVCVDYDKAIKHWLGDAKINVSFEFEKLLANIADLKSAM